MLKTKNYLNALTLRISIIVLLIQQIQGQTKKLYLTQNQSMLLIPQQYIDQTIHTEYTIQGTSITIHQALQTIKKYNQFLEIATNSQGQSLIRMQHTIQDITFLYYVAKDGYLKYAIIKLNLIDELLQLPLDWGTKIQGMEIFKQFQVLIWSNKSLGVVRIDKNSPNLQGNFSYSILRLDLPSTLVFKINQCHFFSQNTYICFTNQNLIQIIENANQNSQGRYQSKLQISHIFYFKEDLKCIVNVYRLQNDLIGLCDCQKGCFNYKRMGNTFVVTIHVEMVNLQQIRLMKLAQGGPKTVTMAVASQKILALMRWGPDEIHVVDTMLLPQLNGGEVWDIVISGDNICLKYRIQANPTILAFQHIFIRYDTIRFQYDQINIILNSPYIFTFFRVLYSISEAGHLQLRMTNPYYLIVDYEQASRYITIKAFNTGKQGSNPQPQNETITILIVSAKQGQVYIAKELTKQIQINYQYSYPMQLFSLFVGRAKQFIFSQSQMPMDGEPGDQKQNIVVVNNYEDEKILSINNMLQCVKLMANGWSFNRIMSSPNNRIYIQECKSQKQQNAGDFVCQIKEIVDTIVDKDASVQLPHIPHLNGQQLNDKSSSEWQLIDIAIQNSKSQLQIWRSKQPIIKQFDLYQFIINTRNICMHLVTHKQSIKFVFERYVLISLQVVTTTTKVVCFMVYDSFWEEFLVQENIPIIDFVKQNEQDPEGVINGSRITNIDFSLRHQNIVYLQYDVVIGFHLNNNKTLAIIMQLTLSKYRTDHLCKLAILKILQVGHFVVYLRVYSNYLYSFNLTHVTKYSLMTISGNTLYTHALQLLLDNPLQFVRNVGQYMLLVYASSYRILDLDRALLDLVIDSNMIQQVGRKGFANTGVYDMIVFGSGILLLGINNKMRAYDMGLIINNGPYPLEMGRIRSYKAMKLTAVPADITKRPVSQQFNLTITYQTKLIDIRGKAIKMLRHLPYQATNQTIIIYENMFTGPIEEYYIADIYDGAIIMLNHIQQIYDNQVHGETAGSGNELAINKWLSVQTTNHINFYSYRLLLRRQINNPINYQPQNLIMLYSNTSNLVVVSLNSGIIQTDKQIAGWQGCPQKYIQYFEYTRNQLNMFVIYSNSCLVYLQYSNSTKSTTTNLFKIYHDYGFSILDISIGLIKGEYLAVLAFNVSKNSTGFNMGYIWVEKEDHKIYLTNATNVQSIAAINDFIIYKKLNETLSTALSNHLLCIQAISSLMSEQSTQQCHPLVKIIPPIYYISDFKSYQKLVAISDSVTENSRIVRILLLSSYDRALHVELALNIKPKGGDKFNWDWQVTNCYTSLSDYKAVRFIGMYVNGTGYDYFVTQYVELQDSFNLQTILVFFRVNDEHTRYCNYASGWVQVSDNEVALIVDTFDPDFYPDMPHQSLMFTTFSVFHLFKNLTFVLNYNKPPTIPYTVINAKNPSLYNKFYSKLVYQADPSQKYLWIYCWIGFGCVGLCLVILKIVSVMIDKGIIRWTKSLSSDEDSGSPGITVHFNSGDGSGGLLTEQASYKSLESS